MAERHVLVGSQFGPVTGHAYGARRNAKPAQERDDLNYLMHILTKNMEEIAKAEGVHWSALLLATTKLDVESSGYIQELIYELSNSEGRQPLERYRDRKEPLFLAVWIMESASDECRKLMELH